MLKHIRLIIIIGLLLVDSLVYCQNLVYDNYQVSSYLRSHSDEILLVKVVSEEFSLPQSFNCPSFVTVQILKNYKSTRLMADLTQLVFTRLYECSSKPVADSSKLILGKKYIIFLSSQKTGSIKRSEEVAKKIYHLADHGLGIQEFNDELEAFLLAMQREKQ
ncbi:MAG: hypothetical protein ACK5PC_01650 [Cyclobacteriaceae bacterium]|jgi:hypothetical protein